MASAPKEEKAESHASGSGGGGGGASKLPMILAAVNLLVTIGMVAILFISFQKDRKGPVVEDIQAGGHEAAAPAEGGHGGGHGAEAGKEGHGGGGFLKKKPDFGKMVTLEQFTVNLSTPGTVNPKFVRVNVSLEVPTDDAEAEVTAKMPQVRNVIIDLFNSKRPADLATAEGRDYLKEEIRNALNSFLVHGKVKGVFFTNFALSS